MPLKNSLEKIKLLKGISYNMNKEFYNIEDPELLSKVMKGKNLKIGFIAQEIKEVFPEVVTLDTTRHENTYSGNYDRIWIC
jgi:hypothetical protein